MDNAVFEFTAKSMSAPKSRKVQSARRKSNHSFSVRSVEGRETSATKAGI